MGEQSIGSTTDDASWDLWRAVVEQTSVCICTSDLETRHFLDVNQAYEKLTGYSAEELRGISYLDLTHPDDREQNMKAVDEVVRGETASASYRKRYIRKDGRVIWVEVNVSLLRDPTGQPVRCAVVTQDIDELMNAEQRRLKADEAVRRSEQRQREILEASTTGVVVNDPSGKFIYANPPLLRLLGYTSDDLESGSLFWDTIQVPERRAEDDRALDQLRATGRCDPYETELVRRDGTRVPVYVGAAFVANDDGEGLLGTAFITDLTALRDAHDELIALNEALDRRVQERTAELEQANDELTGFTYHVSHDLRAPLRAIVATSRMLQQDFADEMTPEAASLLARQVTAANKLGTLIDELLKLARLTREKLDMEQVDVTKLAREVAAEHALDNQLASVVVEDDLVAFADPRLLRLLLGNLISNALIYSPKGGTISVGWNGETFFVKDEGIGFDMQYADKLFKPFERLVRDTDFPGTGVGLANVARIVAKHEGRVWAESEPNQGATFYFTLGA